MLSSVYIVDGCDLAMPENFSEFRLDTHKDLGVIRGWQCGTMLEAQLQCLFHFYDHYLRLKHSTERLTIPFEVSPSTFEKAIKTVVRNSGYMDALIFIRLSRGMTDDTVNPAKYFEKRALVSISVFQGQRQTMPIRLATREYDREYPDIKHTNYLFAELQYPELFKKGVHDILYLDRGRKHRFVSECARKNIGIVSDGKLTFPSGGILEGVTMRIVSELARQAGFIISRPIIIDFGDLWLDLKARKKSIIATSTTGVIPVEEIDGLGIPIDDDTRRLCDAFRRYREEYYKTGGANEIRIPNNQG